MSDNCNYSIGENTEINCLVEMEGNKVKLLSGTLPETVLTQILETAFQWFVVVDQQSRIMYINEDYCKFLEVDREEAIGNL